jgi:hypothetical protein
MGIWMFKLNYSHKTEAILVDQKKKAYMVGQSEIYISIFVKVESVGSIRDRCLRWLATLLRVTLPDETAALLLCGSLANPTTTDQHKKKNSENIYSPQREQKLPTSDHLLKNNENLDVTFTTFTKR